MHTTPERLSDPPTQDLANALESFARDLLVLIKTCSVYPAGHPSPQRVAERLTQWTPTGPRSEFSLGITPTRFLVNEQFLGAAGSRIAALAALLHGRKVMRLTWGAEVRVEDVTRLAATLSRTQANGPELCAELRAAGVRGIELEPLDIAKIHGTLMTAGSVDAGHPAGGARGLDAWLWLQDAAVQPEDLAQAVISDDLWQAGKDDPGFPLRLLFQHGRKLDRALGLLPPAERERVRGRLVSAGGALPMADLASVILAEVRRGNDGGEAVSCLLGQLGPEDLVELMASVVALSKEATPRVLAAFLNLAPRIDAEQVLPIVEARLSQPEAHRHAAGTWRHIKNFLLDLEEGGFFGDDYLAGLERLSAGETAETSAAQPDWAAAFAVDPEPHLDWIYTALAGSGEGPDVALLVRRLHHRLPVLPLLELLPLARAANQVAPTLWREAPELLQGVFARVVAGIRFLNPTERLEAVAFARAHEDLVLAVVLDALLQERRIATRRFLVDTLSSFSPDTTAAMVARTLTAPWYYVRNVATVLGRRKNGGDAHVLEALLDYPHDKVRKEALRGLGQFGNARSAVEKFARDGSRAADERRLAQRILARGRKTP